jgi:hypothetical protein
MDFSGLVSDTDFHFQPQIKVIYCPPRPPRGELQIKGHSAEFQDW